MNTPIKSAHPPQPRPEPAARPAPPVADLRPGLPSLRRTEPERARSTLNPLSQDTPLSADGLFFSQMLVTPVGEQPDQSGFGGGGFSFPAPPSGAPAQLIDELAQRLPDQPDGPFRVTLLMPNLGTVQVNANQSNDQWRIELGFARRGVARRLQPHRSACRDALAQALGQDVDLSFHEDLGA